jgi:tripartite-type tricarboxylate transporter receptor subunit TctC
MNSIDGETVMRLVGSNIVGLSTRMNAARPRPGELLVALVLLALCGGHTAWAQATRTIKLVVPFAAGGPTDLVGRLLADEISRTQGLAVVVENRTGAGSAVGTEAVARAAPDGNTLLLGANGFVVLPHVRKLNYDPLTSFEAICHILNYPNVVAVNTASPYRKLADLLDAARARPGALTIASVGPATGSQVSVEMLKRAAKVDLTFVPYTGYAPAINALLGGHVTSVFADYSVVAGQLRANTLRALAVSSPARTAVLPDVPTVAESGYKDYEAEVWYGLFAPAHTPAAMLSQIASWFTAALKAQDVRRKLEELALFPDGTCGPEFSAFLRKQYDAYGHVIREAGIKAE